MKLPEIQFAQLPHICDECAMKLLSQAAVADEGMNQILHHCPHHETVILVTFADVDGKRSITKWIFESPATQDYAIAMATRLGESMGAELEFFHSGTVQ